MINTVQPLLKIRCIRMSTTGSKEQAGQERPSLDKVRERILAYEHEVKEYLDHLGANVDYYKFSVEKHEDGISVEVSIKATIRPKASGSTTGT